MRVVVIANQKGGCGKTTTAVNLSACLGTQGKRVLLVDLDPQSHATIALTDPEATAASGVAELLSGDAAREDAVRPAAYNLDMLGSSPAVDDLEGQLAADPARWLALVRLVKDLSRDYDLAVLDCPPNTGPLTRAALAASDFLLLPVETSYFALYGVGRMLRLVREEEARRGSALPYGVLLTLFDRRTTHAREILKQLREHFGRSLFATVVSVNVSLREAASHGRPITEYRRRSKGYQHYLELSTELMLALDGLADRETVLASGGKQWMN